MSTPYTQQPRFSELERYRLWGSYSKDKSSRASMQWGVASGNPYFNVWVPNSEKRKPVRTGLSPEAFLAAMTLVEMVSRKNEACEYQIGNSTLVKDPDREGKKVRRKVSELFIGRNDDGLLYFRVQAEEVEDRPGCDETFLLEFGDFHMFHKPGGIPLTEREASSLFAQCYAGGLRAVILPCTGWTTESKKADAEMGGSRGSRQAPKNTQGAKKDQDYDVNDFL